jgi:hypothetical protein
MPKMTRTQRFTFLLCLAGMGLAAGADPYSREEGQLWVAGNDSVEIAIDRTSGTIRRLLDKAGKEDYCRQVLRSATADTDGNTAGDYDIGERIGGLTLIDELRDKQFSDLADKPKIANVRAARQEDSVSLSLDKLFPGAEFRVTETFRVTADHVRWDVRVKKTAGPDRTIRVTHFAPLPVGHYDAWAPISDAPFPVKPYVPFAIDYGQSTSGAVGEGRGRTTIPMMVFYSRRTNRALAFTSPFEVPAVRIRFLNNTGAAADFYWNSRQYPMRERPYFQVSNENLGARDRNDIETGLLISTHPADWRPALGWVYSKYRKYFDPDPGFEKWDGAFVMGYPLMRDSYTEEKLREIYAGRQARGSRWEELHGHFPWYGLMIPDAGVKSWTCESHPSPGPTMPREKIAAHARLTREFGIGTFLYYNTTEAENWYAQKEFPESVAKAESGKPVGAFRAERFPDKRACWLMNADPASPFGQHMIRQARQMVETYPAAAGFFWDVYGRSYMFDFAHDDGITMVNNKPAYYPEFMFHRLMREHIRPLLRGKGMHITANKPVTVVSCEGLDGIMAMEDAPAEESPAWITAQSYLGLNRHVMIFEARAASAERMYLHCLRYGMLTTDVSGTAAGGTALAQGGDMNLAGRYRPFIERLRGKQWIFHPRALELPANTYGNVFRMKDGSVMATVVSAWRHLRKAEGWDENLEVICRLPDAEAMRHVYVSAIDLGATAKVEPARSGDTLRIKLPRHGKATAVVLSARPDAGMEDLIQKGAN